MGDQWSILLNSFLNYTNFYSILIVLLCFCSMVVFIVRLNGEHLASRLHRQSHSFVPVTPVVGVNNPFMLKLDTSLPASLKDGLHCHVHCNESCELYTYWGVDLSCVHMKIRKSWRHLLLEVKTKSFFTAEQCNVQDEPKVFDPGEEHQVHLYCDSISEEDLGQPPRTKYPLVVMMVPCDTHTNEDYSIIAMVTIFHLKDSVCPGASHIVYQFVISNTGQVCPLQQLFMNQLEEDSHQPEDDQQQRDCVVCQSAAASRAILPCRHACVCSQCFTKIDKCPMCRGNIESFFFLDGQQDQEYMNQFPNPAEEIDLANMTWQEMFEYWNGRLNDVLGFP